MDTSEPPAKSFMDSEVTIDFSDSAIIHDRELLVDGKKFYVNSSLLSQFSEFFNGLFNSNFKEKNEETIELKDIPFLRALYPIRFKVTGGDLAGLMQLSNRFLCPTVWSLCLEFLKNKDEFNKFSPRELLEWSEGSSQELKTLIEEDLIENNVVGRTLTISRVEVIEFRKLALKCNPDKLKDSLEEFIFNDPERKTHYGLVDLLYYSVKYDLPKVRNHLDILFCGLVFHRPTQVHIGFCLLKICRLPKLEVKILKYMLQLVDNIHEEKNFLAILPSTIMRISRRQLAKVILMQRIVFQGNYGYLASKASLLDNSVSPLLKCNLYGSV